MLELYYKLFKIFCGVDENEDKEKATESPHFVLSEDNLDDVFLQEKRDKGNAMRSRTCTDTFTAKATVSFFPILLCNRQKNYTIKKTHVCSNTSLEKPKRYVNEETLSLL